MLRATYDPKQTPYLAHQEDVARVHRALAAPWSVLYALTALAGLRPGEALAVEWGDLELGERRILVQRQVRHGRVRPPKSGKPRVVAMLPTLAKVLAEFKLATGGEGKLFPAAERGKRGERGTPSKYLDPTGTQRQVRDALEACGLPPMTWYSAGRHRSRLST
jgi:integrase